MNPTTTRGRYAAPRKPRTRNPYYIFAALAAGLLLLIGACTEGGTSSTAAEAAELDQTVLETARATCAPGSAHITVGDGGNTLLIDHQGEDETSGASIDDVVCVLFELGVPDSVVAQMEATRALDGRQSASWDGYAVSWAYHPDSGLDMIVTEG